MRITITVPEPCHENWNAMTPHGSGRHCERCDHVVTDLTRATDAELVTLFTSDARPKCARFDPAQLDRALNAPGAARMGTKLPIAAFTTLAAVASGCENLAQDQVVRMGEPAMTAPPIIEVDSSTPAACRMVTGDTLTVVEEIVGEVAIPVPEQPMTEFCGTVVDDRTGEPLPFVLVKARNTTVQANTDPDGVFRLYLPARAAKDPLIFDAHYLGYAPVSRVLRLEESNGPENAAPAPEDGPVSGRLEDDPYALNGSVTDVDRGHLMPGTLVRIAGTDVVVRCDARGFFGLLVPEELRGQEIMLEFNHPEAGAMTLPVPTHRLPLELPVKFRGDALADGTASPNGCRSVGELRLEPSGVVLGGPIIAVEKPTAWQRIARPFTRKH